MEKPDLEKRRVELLKKEEHLKIKLFALQDKILIELANAQGNILENKVKFEIIFTTQTKYFLPSSLIIDSLLNVRNYWHH